MGRAKRVGRGLPAAREGGHGLPWVQTPPEPVLSPGRRDLPPLLHWPGHRWHRHPEEHGAVQHGRHCHVSAGHRQVAGSRPRAPRPAAGEGGRGPLPRGNGPGRPSVGLSLSCPRGHQQSTGSAPMSLWLSHALEPHPLVGARYPSPSLPFSEWVTRAQSGLFWKGEGSGWPNWVPRPQQTRPLFALPLGAPAGARAPVSGLEVGGPAREGPGPPAGEGAAGCRKDAVPFVTSLICNQLVCRRYPRRHFHPHICQTEHPPSKPPLPLAGVSGDELL